MDYLIDIGSYDQPPILDTEDDTLPPLAEEDTEDDESGGENELMGRENELVKEPIEEGNPREEPSVEYELKEDPKRNL